MCCIEDTSAKFEQISQLSLVQYVQFIRQLRSTTGLKGAFTYTYTLRLGFVQKNSYRAKHIKQSQ